MYIVHALLVKGSAFFEILVGRSYTLEACYGARVHHFDSVSLEVVAYTAERVEGFQHRRDTSRDLALAVRIFSATCAMIVLRKNERASSMGKDKVRGGVLVKDTKKREMDLYLFVSVQFK